MVTARIYNFIMICPWMSCSLLCSDLGRGLTSEGCSTDLQERDQRRLRMRGNSVSFPVSALGGVCHSSCFSSVAGALSCFSYRVSIDSIANRLSPANLAVAAALLLFIFGLLQHSLQFFSSFLLPEQ